MSGASGVELFGRRIEPVADADDRPVGLVPSDTLFISDAVVDALGTQQVRFVALRPGAAFSALHDSVVNHRGNYLPTLLPCLDQAHALDVAFGHALASGQPLVVGCEGPSDVTARLRAFGDRQLPLIVLAPGDFSGRLGASFKAVFQPDADSNIDRLITAAAWTSTVEPPGPVLVVLPETLMERRIQTPAQQRGPRLRRPQSLGGMGFRRKDDLIAILDEVNAPLILVGRVGRGTDDWARLLAFAEAHGSKVVTAFGDPASFDVGHPLHVGQVGGPGHDAALQAYCDADVVLAVNWSDWAVLETNRSGRRRNFLIAVGLNWASARDGGATANGDLPDLVVQATPSDFLRDAATALDLDDYPDWSGRHGAPTAATKAAEPQPGQPIDHSGLLDILQHCVADGPATLAHLPPDWGGPAWRARGPLDALGSSDRSGLGSCVGAALALQDQGRLVVGLVDGVDLAARAAHLWTATHFKLPLLIVVLNRGGIPGAADRQAAMARARGREERNASVGTGFAVPAVDVASLARAFGATCLPRASTMDQLATLAAQGAALARQGGAVLIEADLVE